MPANGGNSNGLLESIQRKLEDDPKNPALHRRFAAANYLYGKVDEALRHLRQAVELSNRDPQYVLSLAEALLDTGYPEQALPLFQEATEGLDDVTRTRAENGRSIAALEAPVIEKLMNGAAETPLPQRRLITGSLMILRGQKREAFEEYSRALEDETTRSLAAENVAFLWSTERNTGGPDVRIKDLLHAARSTETSYRMDLYLADAYSHSGLFENAARHAAQALSREPRYIPAYTQALMIIRQMEMRDAPGSDALRQTLDEAAGGLEETEPALAELARAKISHRDRQSIPEDTIRQTLASEDPFVRLMGALEARDNLPPNEASELLTHADLGDSCIAGLTRARLCLETKGIEEAAPEAEKALLAHPERAEAAQAVLYFWGLRRRLQTASAMLKAAIEPRDMEPERFLEIGMTLVEAGRMEDALSICRNLTHPQALTVKARALSRMGRLEDAVSLLEGAVAGMNRMPREFRRELARLYFASGRDKDALELLSDGE